MEPVSDIIGHCFVVGDTRHQLRASMSAGWRGSAGQVRRNFRQLSLNRTTGKIFSQLSPHRTTGFFFHSCPTGFFFRSCRLGRQPRHFFPGKNPDLGAGSAGGFYAGQVARPARLQCRAGGAPGRLCQARQAPSRTLTVPRVLAIRAICAMGLTRQATEHPLSPGPCYMCYMCYMALYSTYTTDFRAYRAGWHPECQASTCQPNMLKQLGSDAGQVARPGLYATQVARPGASMPRKWRAILLQYCGNETQPWINIGNLSL